MTRAPNKHTRYISTIFTPIVNHAHSKLYHTAFSLTTCGMLTASKRRVNAMRVLRLSKVDHIDMATVILFTSWYNIYIDFQKAFSSKDGSSRFAFFIDTHGPNWWYNFTALWQINWLASLIKSITLHDILYVLFCFSYVWKTLLLYFQYQTYWYNYSHRLCWYLIALQRAKLT